eukprot:684094-Pleurochrysis_carterae.AAC.1
MRILVDSVAVCVLAIYAVVGVNVGRRFASWIRGHFNLCTHINDVHLLDFFWARGLGGLLL